MYSKKVILLSFFSVVHVVNCRNQLFQKCFSQDNYAATSPYGDNLNGLFNLLQSKVPPTGFGLGSIGQGENRVQGLALCRGDVSSESCKSCVIEAGKEIMERCPLKKGAIIWYDNCLLKYSHTNFFCVIDNANKFYMFNVNNVDDPTSFNQNTTDLLNRLANKAYLSSDLFATGEIEIGGSKKLYGLVQCTRDLLQNDCKNCLDQAISELPNCCDGKEGGRVVGGSCNFRYEIYPFVNA